MTADKRMTFTSFCACCGFPIRYEVEGDDELRNRELCEACRPVAASMAVAQIQMNKQFAAVPEGSKVTPLERHHFEQYQLQCTDAMRELLAIHNLRAGQLKKLIAQN